MTGWEFRENVECGVCATSKLCGDYSNMGYDSMLIDNSIRTFRKKFITPYVRYFETRISTTLTL
jgi:hypothetical protein